ncbi:MAG: carboxymuconolactone decarboxylase family protein [Alphaproteobacteria bacterium]|nr:carboxymuconolactone decarboxylase family protein [Alphaproteobacteria bacterium]
MPPRIPPLADHEMDERQRELIAPYAQDGHTENVFRTMAQYPGMLRRWGPMIGHVLVKNSLLLRDREILILRTGYLCRAEYEWAQHVRIAKGAGMTDGDIAAIMAGNGLSPHEDALLCAAEELWRDARIADATWALLAKSFSRDQMMDVVFTVGQYTLVSMALNSFGVELDHNVGEYPRLPARSGAKA